jgi:hypothetical protein
VIIFLDFDGVLHPENVKSQEPLLCRLPLVEEVLREFPQVQIVISSTWRLRWQDPEVAGQEMCKHFSADIALRVTGVTPTCLGLDWRAAPDGLFLYPRQWECETWLRAHRPPGTPWLALDDRAYWFRPFCKSLMIVNRDTGFVAANAEELRERLRRLGSEMKRA